MKRVIIILEGQWGTQEKGHYKQYAEAIKRTIEGIKRRESRGPDEEEIQVAEVEIIDTYRQVRERIIKTNIDILIFLSRSMISKAKNVKKLWPSKDVLVLTGLIPEDEIIILNKTWVSLQLWKDIL